MRHTKRRDLSDLMWFLTMQILTLVLRAFWNLISAVTAKRANCSFFRFFLQRTSFFTFREEISLSSTWEIRTKNIQWGGYLQVWFNVHGTVYKNEKASYELYEHVSICHSYQSIPVIACIMMCSSELLETGNRTKMSLATSAFLYVYAISAVIIFHWDSKELDMAWQFFV